MDEYHYMWGSDLQKGFGLARVYSIVVQEDMIRVYSKAQRTHEGQYV